MRKQYWLFFGVVVLMLLFVFQNDEPEMSSVSESAPQEELPKTRPFHDKVQAEEEKSSSVTRNRMPSGLITESEIKNLRSSLPDTREARKEARENPHQTPDSLMDFASTLGPLVEKAKKNPENANLLVKELSSCVSQDQVIVSARTVCLHKAEQLAKIYPELTNEVREMRKTARQDVRDLSDKMNSYLIK